VRHLSARHYLVHRRQQRPWRDDRRRRFAAGQGQGRGYKKLDQPTAIEIYAALGKQLLGPEEFFAAAFGVTEGTSLEDDPETTKLDAPRTSKWGVMQATGNMSTWGTDGDPDGQRQAWRFGGGWVDGGFAGSRYATSTTGRATRTSGSVRAAAVTTCNLDA
jgi:hypothetical protein